jgi:uncharacterized membrane protein
MKRILIGISLLFSLILNIVMIITFGVLEFISAYYNILIKEKTLSIFTLCFVSVMTITLSIVFLHICKKEKKKPALNNLFKELSDYSIYIEDDNTQDTH